MESTPLPSPEIVDQAGQRLVEFGVIGAAFVLLFFFCGFLVMWVLRAAAREIRAARETAEKANGRSFDAAEKATENYTRIAERLERMLSMQSRMIDTLQVLVLRGDHHVRTDPPEDG